MVVNGAALATIIVAAFGGVWCLYGALGLPSRLRAVLIAVAFVVSTTLVILGARHTRMVASRFDLPVYYASVAFEVLAIIIVARLLRILGRRTLIGPCIAAIVGLHFIGLWLATNDLLFIWLSIALCAVGGGAVLLQPAGRTVAAGIGSALVLWFSAIVMIVR